MKRLFLLLFIFSIFCIQSFFNIASAEGDCVKVMSLNYDTSSSLIYISTKTSEAGTQTILPQKYVTLQKPNRIYFDIENAVLIGEKQHLLFDNSVIKEIKLAQFSTTPKIVRTVITFEEDFDTSKIKLKLINGNIAVISGNLNLNSKYFNTVYDDNPTNSKYFDIIVNSEIMQKIKVPVDISKNSPTVVNDIQKAFAETTLLNSNGTTYDSAISVELSSGLKLRTKFFINQYTKKNNGLLVSGLGQLTTKKIFYLTSPKRAVIDLPDTFLDKSIRNREILLSSDVSGRETAKIGQFNNNTARIVITSNRADKYIPLYSEDLQSLLIADTEKLDHTKISPVVSNISKAYVKTSPKTNELILSFSAPIVYSIVRNDNSLTMYMFNVKSYNEADLSKTLGNTYFKNISFSLLPKTGVKCTFTNLDKNDIIDIQQGMDSKALKIVITGEHKQPVTEKIVKKRNVTKNKVVLDAGHGGYDYGAIRAGINEKDITLELTRRVENILKSKGYKVALTRADDTYVSLEDRVTYSEEQEPEIFVSIHVNSAVSPEPFGLETHYYHDYSKELADTVHKHLVKEIKSKDRGLFKSKFYVINHTTDPAILVEVGFLSNEEERNDIITESRKQKTAKAIAEGIMEYLKNSKTQKEK